MMRLIFISFAILSAQATAAPADLQLRPGQTVSFSQGFPEYKPGAAAEQATQVTVCSGEKCESRAIGKPAPRLIQFQLEIAADLINAHLAGGKSMKVKAEQEQILGAVAALKNGFSPGVRKYVEALEKRTTMAQVRVDAYESKFGPMNAPVQTREPSSH